MSVRLFRVTGIVQGVGFRPFIHRIAEENKLFGWILNDSEGVLIEVQGKNQDIDKFVKDIRDKKPPISQVDQINELETNTKDGTYTSFFIKASVQMEETKTLIPPDSFVCEDCLNEMFDKENRRYRYPFINCTNCGPRFSIIKSMPYDRKSTTMNQFKMCPICQKEYDDIRNRRYHAQPNACPVCGPQLFIRDKEGEEIVCEDEVTFIIQKLLEGKIVAVKSLGGYHLAVNAKDDKAVKRLRYLKKRDSKPFALMMKDVCEIKKYMEVNEEEEKLLLSEKRPIVLLKKKPNTDLAKSIAPHNPCFGVMLPSAPVHYLLLENCKLNVLVMTSGNISGEPIVFKNEMAFQKLRGIADFFLMNNRDIHIRIDDSIVRDTCKLGDSEHMQTVIRRARGFAPYPIKIKANVKKIFAFGSELKNTIAVSKDNQVYISQHIGDVKNDEIFNSLLKCKKHFEEILSIKPEYYVCDLHPGFRSSRYAEEQKNIPIIKVQHHHAHMAACMAENNIDNTQILGIIFDGTGYGIDETIWGGEFLVGNYESVKRVGTFSECKLIGGDKAVREPIRVAYDLLLRVFGHRANELDLPVIKQMTDVQKRVYEKMDRNNINTFTTTSMGRLFDGISALLGICYVIEYEGQAAIELEAILDRDFMLSKPFEFSIEKREEKYVVVYDQMIREIVERIQEGASSEDLSRRFHSTIIEMTKEMALKIQSEYHINTIVLSGGVFMNEYLLFNMVKTLRTQGFKVFYHERVPTNDGGLSLGQVMVANYMIGESKNEQSC